MKKNAQTLANELGSFRTKIKNLIGQTYRENVKDNQGEVMSEAFLAEEWEYEGQELNAISEQGLAYIVDGKIEELFLWDDLDIESLIEILQVLEDKEFVLNASILA